jgi:hypothetical protein
MAEPYRSQGSASGSNFSGASPEAFGAAVGRGLEEAGGSIDRAIHTIKERDRDNQVAAAGVELAQISTDIDTAAIDARNAAAPGGEGHSAAVAKTIQERSTEALGRIKDPHVRQIFQQRYADLHERVYTREHGWEAVARAEKLVTDFDTTGTTYANAQATNPTPDGLASALTDVHAAGNALAVSADVKTKAVREQQRKVAVGWGNAMQDKDPKSLIATLDHGVLNEYLEPEDIKALRSGAHVELRRAEAEQRQQLSIAQADARERINLIGKRVAAGDFSVTDAEFDGRRGRARRSTISKGRASILACGRTSATSTSETRTFTRRTWDRHDRHARGEGRQAHRRRKTCASIICSSPLRARSAASTRIPTRRRPSPATRRRKSIGRARIPARLISASLGRAPSPRARAWSTCLICRSTS